MATTGADGGDGRAAAAIEIPSPPPTSIRTANLHQILIVIPFRYRCAGHHQVPAMPSASICATRRAEYFSQDFHVRSHCGIGARCMPVAARCVNPAGSLVAADRMMGNETGGS